MFSSFLHCLSLPPGSSGASGPPAARQAPMVFFMVSNTTKILHFYLERAGFSLFLFMLIKAEVISFVYALETHRN